jgi:hypothetical protein
MNEKLSNAHKECKKGTVEKCTNDLPFTTEDHYGIDDSTPSDLLKIVSPETFFKEAIEKRKVFSNFMNKSFPELDTFVNDYMTQFNDENFVSWIGGSRSWAHTMKKYIDKTNNIDELTRSAVFTPGNYDIFTICHNSFDINKVFKDIDDMVNGL